MKTLNNFTSLFTETENIYINMLVFGAVLLIAVTLAALIIGLVRDPSLIENASF